MMNSSTHGHMKQILTVLMGGVLSLLLWLPAAPAHAYDNPELLPEVATSIIDLANSLSSRQEEELNAELEQFEAETGWKLRVLTQYDRTPGRAVKDFWGLNDYSVMLVADPRGGNLLNFSVGDAVYDLLPRTFWIELQTRFGNQFYVRENGEDRSILDALGSIETCLPPGRLQRGAGTTPRTMDINPGHLGGGWGHLRLCGPSQKAGDRPLPGSGC